MIECFTRAAWVSHVCAADVSYERFTTKLQELVIVVEIDETLTQTEVRNEDEEDVLEGESDVLQIELWNGQNVN